MAGPDLTEPRRVKEAESWEIKSCPGGHLAPGRCLSQASGDHLAPQGGLGPQGGLAQEFTVGTWGAIVSHIPSSVCQSVSAVCAQLLESRAQL